MPVLAEACGLEVDAFVICRLSLVFVVFLSFRQDEHSIYELLNNNTSESNLERTVLLGVVKIIHNICRRTRLRLRVESALSGKSCHIAGSYYESIYLQYEAKNARRRRDG